jgi:hypothetical protein
MDDNGDMTAVGRLAGPGRGNTDLTPRLLIGKYCQPGMELAWRSGQRAHSRFHAGFIGSKHHGHGYADGDGYLASMVDGGWCPLPGAGSWPLEIYLAWPAHPSDRRYCFAHYRDGDFAIEVFDSKEAATNALAELPAVTGGD